MRAVLAAAIVAALAVPAFAQDTHVPRYGEKDKDKTDSEKAAEKADAAAYQRSLNAIPDKGSNDPWGAVRADAPKTAATKPVKKTKTGSAEPKAE